MSKKLSKPYVYDKYSSMDLTLTDAENNNLKVGAPQK